MRQPAPSQLIGANFCFQHYPFDKVAKLLSDLGMREFGSFGNGFYALDPVATWKQNLVAVDPYFDRASVSA